MVSSAMALVAMFVVVIVAMAVVVAVGVFRLARYEIFGEGAYSVQTGLVGSGKKVLEGRQHMLAELRLANARKAAVGAKALH